MLHVLHSFLYHYAPQSLTVWSTSAQVLHKCSMCSMDPPKLQMTLAALAMWLYSCRVVFFTHLYDGIDIMSIQTTTTLADFFAFRVIAPQQSIDEAFPLVAGVTVRVMIRGQWRAFTPNTVVSYALRYNEDPIAAHERAVARGHQTHWMNQDAVALTDGPHGPQEIVVGLGIGQLVQLEGRLFRLAAASNGNVDLMKSEA